MKIRPDIAKQEVMKENKSIYLGNFTLLELLIVISIIVILLALLLPTLRKAKLMGNRISCAGNQKQIFTAWMTYEQDFNYTPMPNRWSIGGPFQRTLADNDYVPYKITSSSAPEGIFRCPSEKNTCSWGSHHGLNVNMGADVPFSQRQWKNLLWIKYPSETLLLADEPVDQTGTVWYDHYIFRHENGWNNIFLDGHYKWLHMNNTPLDHTDKYWGDYRYWK